MMDMTRFTLSPLTDEERAAIERGALYVPLPVAVELPNPTAAGGEVARTVESEAQRAAAAILVERCGQ